MQCNWVYTDDRKECDLYDATTSLETDDDDSSLTPPSKKARIARKTKPADFTSEYDCLFEWFLNGTSAFCN